MLYRSRERLHVISVHVHLAKSIMFRTISEVPLNLLQNVLRKRLPGRGELPENSDPVLKLREVLILPELALDNIDDSSCHIREESHTQKHYNNSDELLHLGQGEEVSISHC